VNATAQNTYCLINQKPDSNATINVTAGSSQKAAVTCHYDVVIWPGNDITGWWVG